MTVTCEHFLYALFPDVGIKLVKTPNLWRLINSTTMQFLQHLGDHVQDATTVQMWFADLKLVTVSYLKPVTDQHGRKGVWNHTILISIDDYLQISQPSTLLSPHLIRSLAAPPQQLTPIQVS